MIRALRLAAVLAALACGVAEATPAAPVVVTITQFRFEGQEISVDAGTTVRWVNRDTTVHNVVSREGKFASAGMDTGDTYEFTFKDPGDFAYLCALHPHMTGVVHVHALAGQSAPPASSPRAG